MLSSKSHATPIDVNTMRPVQIAYDVANVSVEQLEALIYQGYAYAVSADAHAAILTSPRADEDVH